MLGHIRSQHTAKLQIFTCWSLFAPTVGVVRGEDTVRSTLFGHWMAHFSATFAMAGSGDTTCFGSLEFPALPPIGMWVPPIFEPSQAFLFGSLDFFTDRLDVLHLSKEALVPAPIGGTPSVGSETHDDFNNEAPVLHSEQTLCSNPAVSNTVIYSLFTIFRQLSRGTPLSLPRPPCDQFSYGLASPTYACAWGLQRTLVPPPLTGGRGCSSFDWATFGSVGGESMSASDLGSMPSIG